MTKAAFDKIADAMNSGVGEVHFLNPFTGKTEPFLSSSHAQARMFEAAAKRINDLEEQIKAIKAFLVI